MMKTKKEENHYPRKHPWGTRTLLMGFALLIGGSAFLAGAAGGSATTFNNVQVFVTTSAQLPYSYSFSAYNLTGSLVASYQGVFPAAAFELPSGDYLFTVSAVQNVYPPCYDVCPLQAKGTVTASGQPASSPAIRYYPPASEYGWQQIHIDSSATISIQTKNVTAFPTTSVTAKVTFVNGTAASGAWVSANIVGQWYYWWGQDSAVVMSAQTGPDGIAKLVLPAAPAVVTAWDWVPVNLPKNVTTVTVNVGGETVNVTVYWQPTYVGLSASTLLIPPADSADLVLHYQQPSYWYLPMGVGYATAPSEKGGATLANQPTGVPDQVNQVSSASTQSGQNQFFQPSQIPALQQQGAPSGASGPASVAGLGAGWIVATVAIGAFAALAAAVVVLGRRNHTPGATV